jgi:hypothetical protein
MTSYRKTDPAAAVSAYGGGFAMAGPTEVRVDERDFGDARKVGSVGGTRIENSAAPGGSRLLSGPRASILIMVTSDWVDEMKVTGAANFPDFALSRQCFFCGRDAAGERERTLVAYLAAGSYDSPDVFEVTSDAWICHDSCVAAANPTFDRADLAEPMRGNESERRPTCFFCGLRSDDPIDETWAIFSLSDAKPSRVAA